jgi:hypothetical protein
MKEQFPKAFHDFFQNSEVVARELLKLKYLAACNCEKQENLKPCDQNVVM